MIKDFYLSDKSSDITIIIDGQRLPSHKFVLSAKSRVFKAMLFGNFKESNDKQIELKETPINAFKLLLKFCYSEQFLLEDKNDYLMAIEVFKLSHRFQMKSLSNLIQMLLISMFSINNIIDIYDLGVMYELKKIQFFAQKFVAKNSEIIIESEKLLKCQSMDTIKEMIGFMKVSQIQVMKALIKIIENNIEWKLSDFLDSIKTDLLTIEDLQNFKDLKAIDSKTLFELALNKCKQLTKNNSKLELENHILNSELSQLKKRRNEY